MILCYSILCVIIVGCGVRGRGSRVPERLARSLAALAAARARARAQALAPAGRPPGWPASRLPARENRKAASRPGKFVENLCRNAEGLAEYLWKCHRVVVGSKQPIAGLGLLAYAQSTEGYGFVEFEMSNNTSSTVFRQPLKRPFGLAAPSGPPPPAPSPTRRARRPRCRDACTPR